MMILQGVSHQKPCETTRTTPKKGYTTPAPALDLTASLRGDFIFSHNGGGAGGHPWGEKIKHRPAPGSMMPGQALSLCTELPVCLYHATGLWNVRWGCGGACGAGRKAPPSVWRHPLPHGPGAGLIPHQMASAEKGPPGGGGGLGTPKTPNTVLAIDQLDWTGTSSPRKSLGQY